MVTVIRSLDTHLVENRRNLSIRPNARSNWSGWAGSGGAFAMTFPVTAGDPASYARMTVTQAGAAGSAGTLSAQVQTIVDTGSYLGRISGRCSRPASQITEFRVEAKWNKPDGSVAGQNNFSAPYNGENNWHHFGEILTPAPGASRLQLTAIFLSPLPTSPGDIYDGTQVLVERTTEVRPYFDGRTSAAGDRSYTWVGAPDTSESIEWLRTPVVNVLPLVVNGFEAARTPGTLLHPILGRPDPDVTFRPGGLRTGTLTLIMPDSATAHAAFAGLLTPRVFELADTDLPELTMRFVVADDDIGLALEDVTRKRWVLTVPFREVTL